VEGVALVRGLWGARHLDAMCEFRDSGDAILFSEVCLVFLRLIRALLEVVVEKASLEKFSDICMVG
jgi:hypothetical protein